MMRDFVVRNLVAFGAGIWYVSGLWLKVSSNSMALNANLSSC